MPRTDIVAPPGCPPVRLLTFDNLGLIKALERLGENGHPQVVARWGEPNPLKGVICVSLSSDKTSQTLAVARKNGRVEILDACNGVLCAEVEVSEKSDSDGPAVHGKPAIVGVHLFRSDICSSERSVMTCTESGNVALHQINLEKTKIKHFCGNSVTSNWSVNKAGTILCMKICPNEKYVACGGDGTEPGLWDIQTQSKIWEAKAPRRDEVGLMSRPFVTSSTFLGDDHNKFIVGTGHHQIRLYDIRAQRRPTLAFDFLESPIKAIEADSNSFTVYAGNGNGDLGSFDMRTGKLLGSFKGQCSGSVRCLTKHPTLPIVAAGGLDRYVRIFDTNTRQLLTRVFLKQQLNAVVFSEFPTVSSDAQDQDGHNDTNNDDIKAMDDDMDKKKRLKRKEGEDESLKRKKKKKKDGHPDLMTKNEPDASTEKDETEVSEVSHAESKKKRKKKLKTSTHEKELPTSPDESQMKMSKTEKLKKKKKKKMSTENA